MATGRTRDAIAALEQARAQIETVLAGNADWPALNRDAAVSGLEHELAFAADPLYRCWKLLGEAIGDLKAKAVQQGPAEPRPAEDERRAAGVVRGPAGPGAGAHDAQRLVAVPDPRSIDLHHVLQYIRDTAARRGDGAAPMGEPPGDAPAPAATALDDAGCRGGAAPTGQEDDTSPEAAMPNWEDGGDLAPELKEATVTFVIREDARPASADTGPPEAAAREGPVSDQWSKIDEEDSLFAPTGGQVEEADVVIVSRRLGLRPRRP